LNEHPCIRTAWGAREKSDSATGNLISTSEVGLPVRPPPLVGNQLPNFEKHFENENKNLFYYSSLVVFFLFNFGGFPKFFFDFKRF